MLFLLFVCSLRLSDLFFEIYVFKAYVFIRFKISHQIYYMNLHIHVKTPLSNPPLTSWSQNIYISYIVFLVV